MISRGILLLYGDRGEEEAIDLADVVRDPKNQSESIYHRFTENTTATAESLDTFCQKWSSGEKTAIELMSSFYISYLFCLGGQMYIVFQPPGRGFKYFPITEIPSYISTVCCDKYSPKRGCLDHDTVPSENVKVLRSFLIGLSVDLSLEPWVMEANKFTITCITTKSHGNIQFSLESTTKSTSISNNSGPFHYISLDLSLISIEDCKSFFEACADGRLRGWN